MGLQRPPSGPSSPANNDFIPETISLPAPPSTRQPEINVPYEIIYPDSCISCSSGSCNEHGQIHESSELLEPPAIHESNILDEAPIPEENFAYNNEDDNSGTDDAEEDNSDAFNFSAPQSSFFDEETDESEGSSDHDDEAREAGPASSDSESEEDEDEDEPEKEIVEGQLLAALHHGPCGRLSQS